MKSSPNKFTAIQQWYAHLMHPRNTFRVSPCASRVLDRGIDSWIRQICMVKNFPIYRVKLYFTKQIMLEIDNKMNWRYTYNTSFTENTVGHSSGTKASQQAECRSHSTEMPSRKLSSQMLTH